MLEQQGLLLASWCPATSGTIGNPAVRKRTISGAATGQVLGFASAPSNPSWWSWWSRQSMQVFETEDASLLMTVSRSWALARTWEVADAEERRVGFIFRGILLDGYGQRLAVAERPRGDRRGHFQSPSGAELGTFEDRENAGIILTFGEVLEGNPFARMTLLGAVLSW